MDSNTKNIIILSGGITSLAVIVALTWLSLTGGASVPPEPVSPVSPINEQLEARAIDVVEPPLDIPQFMGRRALTRTVSIYWTYPGVAIQPVTHVVTEASVIRLGIHTRLVDNLGVVVAQQTFILSPTITATDIIPTGLFAVITYSYPYTATGHGIVTETIQAAWYIDGDIIKLEDLVQTVDTGRLIYFPIIMKGY